MCIRDSITRYDGARLVHGEAVAIGMACAFRFSVRRGLCGKEDQARVEAHLQDVGLPVRLGSCLLYTSLRRGKRVTRLDEFGRRENRAGDHIQPHRKEKRSEERSGDFVQFESIQVGPPSLMNQYRHARG